MKQVTGVFLAFWNGHRATLARIVSVLGELRPPKDPDRRDAEMLLAKLDDAEQPERARLVRVSAEPPSPAGPSAAFCLPFFNALVTVATEVISMLC